jgi:pSer/pThr/pTyr-binding forkhead associated (FHA) protein
VQRFGYAFSGVVDQSVAVASARREPASCWIVWGVRRIALAVGENILGRDPAVDINIDAVGVSRRHAVIVVAADEITLADLASKNGTFVNGMRVTGSVRLTDDTELRLGPVAVRFCTLPNVASTQTWDAAQSSGPR